MIVLLCAACYICQSGFVSKSYFLAVFVRLRSHNSMKESGLATCCIVVQVQTHNTIM